MNTFDINTPMIESLVHKLPATRRQALQERLVEHGPRLQSLFSSLYPHPDDSHYLQRLLEIMVDRASARSDELHALDEQRRQNPGWFTSNRQLGYMAYTDRFAGTLAGIEQRIAHLQSLGVTYLHLLPFLKARAGENDGGFAVSSFNEVNPQLGTRKDLEHLTRQLRNAGISLCSDVVLNHVADDHAWVRNALAGEEQYRAYFHILQDRPAVDAWEQTLNQVFPETAPGNFTWNDTLGAWVWTTFYPYQWDLNYSNPAVLVEMVDAILDLANLGVEAFRLDSAGYLWKQRGTACMNLPQTHQILQLMRACTDIVAPAVLLKAEAIVPTRQLPPYFGMGSNPGAECHLAYHSSLMTAIWLAITEQRSDLLQRVIAGTPQLPEHASWITYIRCHDDIGWNVLRPELLEAGDAGFSRLVQAARFIDGQSAGSFSDGQAFQSDGSNRIHGSNGMTASLLGFEKAQTADTLARLNLVFGLIATIGGLPLIYMGDEFAQPNAKNIPSGTWAAEDGRRLQRPFWNEALTRTAADSIHQKQLQQIRHWQHVRCANPSLAATAQTQLLSTGDGRVLAFLRGTDTLVVANLSEQRVDVSLQQAGELTSKAVSLKPWDIRVEKRAC